MGSGHTTCGRIAAKAAPTRTAITRRQGDSGRFRSQIFITGEFSAPPGRGRGLAPVAMPISAPMPNSPQSANCVRALWKQDGAVQAMEKRVHTA